METDTPLSTSPFQEAVESNVNSLPPFLRTTQTRCRQPLLTGHAFQPCLQLCCPLLDAVKYLHILLKLWDPDLHTEQCEATLVLNTVG